MEVDIKINFDIELATRFCSLQNLPGKTTTPKQERKLLVKRQITVKSPPKRTEKTSLSITLPLVLPLLNYEEPMTKNVGTQVDNTLSQLLEHDYSLYHTDYSKNNNFGIGNPGIFNTDSRFEKGNMFFNKHYCSRIKN